MIIALWHRSDRLPTGRLETALEILSPTDRGALFAFSAMVRRRAFRPFTIGLSMLRASTT